MTDSEMIAWEIWEEDFGSGLSNVTGKTLEYVTGLDSKDEVWEYIRKKYPSPPWLHNLFSVHKRKITVVTRGRERR